MEGFGKHIQELEDSLEIVHRDDAGDYKRQLSEALPRMKALKTFKKEFEQAVKGLKAAKFVR